MRKRQSEHRPAYPWHHPIPAGTFRLLVAITDASPDASQTKPDQLGDVDENVLQTGNRTVPETPCSAHGTNSSAITNASPVLSASRIPNRVDG